MRTFRHGLAVWVGRVSMAMAVFGSATIHAEVTAHDDESGRRPVVILELNGLTDGGEPVESLTEQGVPVDSSIWIPYRAPGGGFRSLNVEGAANGDGRPSIVINPVSGVPIAAWSKASPAGYDVVISRLVDGEWTLPVAVAAGAGDEHDAKIVADDVGGLHLVYWVHDGAQARVEYRSGELTGQWFGDAIVVSSAGEVAVRPSIDVRGGTLRVAYESHVAGLDATPRQIVVAERRGGIWGGDVVSETWFDAPNRPEIHALEGRVWVDWIDGSGSIRWSRRDADGHWTPDAIEPFETVEDRDYHARGRIKAAVCSD